MRVPGVSVAVVLAIAATTACGTETDPAPAQTPSPDTEPAAIPQASPSPPDDTDSPTPEPTAGADPPTTSADSLGEASPRPDWLSERPLPERDDGFGEIRDTPAELVDRRLPPPPEPDLPAPPADGSFAATIEPVPDRVAARSTWRPECPVELDELRYLTVTFRGFDDRAHTGELIVHHRVAEDVVGVFERLFRARFPVEELRVVREEELDAPPTGDGNTSTAFVCREVTTGESWSQHAYGLAVDLNPFHNPYVRDDVVVPELASAYLDRGTHRPGMIQRGDAVTEAFAAIGWRWGGDWQSLQDWMHFSESGG